jgi:hypothetical protein
MGARLENMQLLRNLRQDLLSGLEDGESAKPWQISPNKSILFQRRTKRQ